MSTQTDIEAAERLEPATAAADLVALREGRLADRQQTVLLERITQEGRGWQGISPPAGGQVV